MPSSNLYTQLTHMVHYIIIVQFLKITQIDPSRSIHLLKRHITFDCQSHE